MSSWRILPGLPAEGPAPAQFSATGKGTHREGFVVKFSPGSDECWVVGNFQPGITTFFTVLIHPNQGFLIVVAGGEGFVIDPKTRELVDQVGGGIEGSLMVSEAGLLLLYDSTTVRAIGTNGELWRTRRVSWDGIWDLQYGGGIVTGVSYDAIAELEVTFQINVSSGLVTGGGYQE